MKKSGNIIAAVLAAIMIFSIAGVVAAYRSEKTPDVATTATDSATASDTGAGIITEDTGASGTETAGITETTAETTKESKTTIKPETKPASSSSQTVENEYYYAEEYPGVTPEPAVIDAAKWNLLLVNIHYFLPKNFAPALAKAASGYEKELDARVAPHYQEMFNAAKSDGYTLRPISGYRSISRQKTNFDNKIYYFKSKGDNKANAVSNASKTIQPPGCSEHNAGLAMDLGNLETKYDIVISFEKTGEFKWLSENASDYGFILRYPAEKKEITGVSYEPWHWRYVGVDAAKAMKSSGQCLEEYLKTIN